MRLEPYTKTFQERARAFFDRILETQGPALFRDTLFLSFLGARICYASSPPLSLFREKRFREEDELLAFLTRLKASGHTSVFAHSPLVVPVELKTEEAFSLARVLYKAWWTEDGQKVCLNLRHFAEVYEEGTFKEILATSLKESHAWSKFRCFQVGFPRPGEPELKKEGPLGDFLHQGERPSGLWATPEIVVIEVPPEITSPFGWLAVIVEGMSRLFSHQFVRHTWLNFNQRSHRYTEVDQFVCPPSFTTEAQKLYQEEIERGLSLYRQLVQQGIKKEDARFVTPQGSATTILATGPVLVWEDFVLKRRHLKAQWEIRNLARALELVLAKINL